MRRDLREGFDYCEMAPFIGWGRIRMSAGGSAVEPRVTERYVSLHLFRHYLFVARCRHEGDSYWRWWCRQPPKVMRGYWRAWLAGC